MARLKPFVLGRLRSGSGKLRLGAALGILCLALFLVLELRTVTARADKSGPPSEPTFLKKSSESFRAVARTVSPAVVVIKSTIGGNAGKKRRGRRGHPQLGPEFGGPDEGEGGQDFNDPLWQFFRHFGGPGGPFNFPMPQDTPQMSLGSGIIVDKSGLIVTNNHVVEGATKVVVNLPSDENTDVAAKVLGTDARSDLAVLKIDRKNLPVAEWGDSDAVEVGDWAIAIGSPFMLTHTVTVGIISAKQRNAGNLMGSQYNYDLIQTDAAINPGNSGGPLCSIDGKVIGVNMAIFTRSGGYMGIGFAVPSNVAKNITATLAQGKKIVRGWLGVTIQPIDETMAKELGIKEGAAVHQVQPDSPADKAGIRAGDVIVEVAGKPVKDVTELQRMVSGLKPGDKVKIKVVNYDDKKARVVNVTIGQLPENLGNQEEEGEAQPETGAPDSLGLVLSGTKSGGVRVEQIQPGSIGEMAGLQPGDVILSVNRTRIKSRAEFEKAIKNKKNLNLVIKRKGREMFFQLETP